MNSKKARCAAASALLFVATGAIWWLARGERTTPYSVPGLLLIALGAPATVLFLGAVYEWLVHRYVYHGVARVRAFQGIHEIHARGHHWHRFPPDRYVESGPVERIPVSPPAPFELCGTPLRRFVAWAGQYALYLSVAVPFAFVPVALVTRNAPFTAAFVGVGLGVCYLFIRVHDVIHYPAGHWLERQAWFRFLDHHHYIHHVDNEANLNFLLPLGDALFGTLRTRLGEQEARRWPSFALAKALPPTPASRTTPVGGAVASIPS